MADDGTLAVLRFQRLSVTLDGDKVEWYTANLSRAPVPGGWLVWIHQSDGDGVTFVPDPEHLWDGGSVDVKRGGE